MSLNMENIESKLNKLENILKGYGKIAVAFSGGVDSTFLLKFGKEVFNKYSGDKDKESDKNGNGLVALTFSSPVFPEAELEFTRSFCAGEGIEHLIINVDLLGNDEFAANSKIRCYTCKRLLFERALKVADEIGIEYIYEGSIADDDDDYRPGKKAIKELGIQGPLKEAGFTKEEIRILSKNMNLPTWEKPAMACLATRIPYGTLVTKEKLSMIEKAESFLIDLGFSQVRVRVHDDLARIEVDPGSIEKLVAGDVRERVYSELSCIGFSYVSVDLRGYRTGSMNERMSEES